MILGNGCVVYEVLIGGFGLTEINGSSRYDRTCAAQIRLCRCRGGERLRPDDIPDADDISLDRICPIRLLVSLAITRNR